MKKINAATMSFVLFLVVFYSSMGMSKYVHVLLFNQSGALVHFGLSYSAMALAGMFSLVYGRMIDRLPLKRALIYALSLYIVGMMLRVVTTSALVAILSGSFAGVGASSILLVIRRWLFTLVEQRPDSKASLFSLRVTTMQLSLAVSTFLAALLIPFVSYRAILLVCPLLLVPLMWNVNSSAMQLPAEERRPTESVRTMWRTEKRLFIGVAFFSATSAASLALLVPFYPIILQRLDVNSAVAGAVVAAIPFLRGIGSSLFQFKVVSDYKVRVYSGIELAIAGLFLASALYVNGIVVIAAMLLSALIVSGSVICQELMEYDLFPKASAAFFFGIAQSFFLMGDSIGGFIGALLYEKMSLSLLFLIYSAATAVIAMSYVLFYVSIIKKRGINDEKAILH